MANEKQPVVGLSIDDLQKMLSTVLAEARKPADPTPEQKAAAEQDQQMRREQAELVLLQMENKKRSQDACPHLRRDGTTPAVYVQDGNYMICQHCQKVVRPEAEPDLYNKLFHLSASPANF